MRIKNRYARFRGDSRLLPVPTPNNVRFAFRPGAAGDFAGELITSAYSYLMQNAQVLHKPANTQDIPIVARRRGSIRPSAGNPWMRS